MGQRKSAADYHGLAESRGYKWVGELPPNSHVKTRWICPVGHEILVRYDDIRVGHGCAHCSGKFPKTVQDYIDIAKKAGIIWLGDKAVSVKTKTLWLCPNGHEFNTTYTEINRGRGCRYCASNVQLLPDDYTKLAQSLYLIWLGPAVSNTRQSTFWQCSNGHKFQARYDNIKSGRGCPECAKVKAGDLYRFGPEKYHALAQDHQLKWLGPEVQKAGSLTWWECPKGHKWHTSYNTIQQGCQCLHCVTEQTSERQTYKPEKYHELAQSLGYKWIGKEVKKANQITAWECSNGHKWQTTYNRLQQGKVNCPYCNQSRGNTRIATVLNSLGISYEVEKSFPECRNKRPLSFDFYIEYNGQRFLIEYDGIQHEHPIDFFGGEKALAETRHRDKIKTDFAHKKGIKLIRISYTEYDNIAGIIQGFLQQPSPCGCR